ncbi:MAG: hypothetical protein NC548_10965 [Lachnospiraceae bacterium]|nr:hypothetical protein [Lachnospiraceae bacterium]MCM1233820.1 hypothetical protein [Ruminococcus flavefaciens]
MKLMLAKLISKLWIVLPASTIAVWVVLIIKLMQPSHENSDVISFAQQNYVYTAMDVSSSSKAHTVTRQQKRELLSSGKLTPLEDVAPIDFDTYETQDYGDYKLTTFTISNSDCIVLLRETTDGTRLITYSNKYGSDLPIILGVGDLPESVYISMSNDVGSAVCKGNAKGNKVICSVNGKTYKYKLED